MHLCLSNTEVKYVSELDISQNMKSFSLNIEYQTPCQLHTAVGLDSEVPYNIYIIYIYENI